MRITTLVVCSSSAALAILACSSSSRNPFEGTDGGGVDGATSDGGGPGKDGSPASDGAGGDSSPAPVSGGNVVVQSYAYTSMGQPVHQYSGSALFQTMYSAWFSYCSPTTDGPCTLSHCPANTLPDAGATASAGVITLTGGSATVTLIPAGTTYNAASSNTQALWSGGETLRAVSAGATVPAFDISLVAPSAITLTAPPWPAMGGKLIVNRSQPLTVSWTGGGAGVVNVSIATNQADGSSNSVRCTYAAAAGTGTVPTSSLATLPTSYQGASVYIYPYNKAEVIVGGWGIALYADTNAKTLGGIGYTVATIQ